MQGSFLFGTLVQAMASPGTLVFGAVITVGLILAVAGAWLFRERLFGGHFE